MEILLVISLLVFMATVLVISWLEKKQNSEEKIILIQEYTVGVEKIAEAIGKSVRNSLGFDMGDTEVALPDEVKNDDGGVEDLTALYKYPEHELLDNFDEEIEEARQAGWMQTESKENPMLSLPEPQEDQPT